MVIRGKILGPPSFSIRYRPKTDRKPALLPLWEFLQRCDALTWPSGCDAGIQFGGYQLDNGRRFEASQKASQLVTLHPLDFNKQVYAMVTTSPGLPV